MRVWSFGDYADTRPWFKRNIWVDRTISKGLFTGLRLWNAALNICCAHDLTLMVSIPAGFK